MTSQPDADPGPEGIEVIYTMSYQYLSVVGLVLTIIVGSVVSLLTGANKPGDVDPRYLATATDTFLFFLPPPLKRWLSSRGPQFRDDKYKSLFPDPADRPSGVNMEMTVSGPGEKSDLDLDVKRYTGDLGLHPDDVSVTSGNLSLGEVNLGFQHKDGAQ